VSEDKNQKLKSKWVKRELLENVLLDQNTLSLVWSDTFVLLYLMMGVNDTSSNSILCLNFSTYMIDATLENQVEQIFQGSLDFSSFKCLRDLKSKIM
jgi:hypothetical protein